MPLEIKITETQSGFKVSFADKEFDVTHNPKGQTSCQELDNYGATTVGDVILSELVGNFLFSLSWAFLEIHKHGLKDDIWSSDIDDCALDDVIRCF